MAHAILEHLVSSTPPQSPPLPRIVVSSAGTGAYHESSPPDPRTMATLVAHGITGFTHSARKVRTTDFVEWDYMLAMDEGNLEDLLDLKEGWSRNRRMRRGSNRTTDADEAQIMLFGDWGKHMAPTPDVKMVVDDPYYGGDEGFETAFRLCLMFARGWLKAIVGLDVDMDSMGNVDIVKQDSKISHNRKD